jgi:hypothetical protein
MDPALPTSPAANPTAPKVLEEDENLELEIDDRAWVPREFSHQLDTALNVRGRSTLRKNQLQGNGTKCYLVINRSGHKFPLYVDQHDTELALKFGIVGGTDNPSFELGLRAWEVPTVQLPGGVKIHSKDGYLISQFPILPYSNEELKRQVCRPVLSMAQAQHAQGPISFTSALQDVIWRHAFEMPRSIILEYL